MGSLSLQDDNKVRVSIPVLGMDCYECSKIIVKTVKKISGVQDVNVNYIMGTVEVNFQPSKTSKAMIEKAIEDAGYKIAYKSYVTMTDKMKSFFLKK